MSDDWFEESNDSSENDSGNSNDNSPKKYDFSMDEAESQGKIVITIAGEKGSGKTMTALSFVRKDKRIAVIQFDEKAAPIKKYFYSKVGNRIMVFSGNKHWNTDPDSITETAYKSMKYIEFILTKLSELPENERPHYVVIDAFEVVSNIAEMAMRYNNKVKPFAGIKNLNIWKERRVYLKSIHNKALAASLEGVIYTIYMDQVDTVIKEGSVQERKTEPKWIDVIKMETDITLHCYSGMKDNNMVFIVEVLNSKIPGLFKTGTKYDTTEKPLMLGGDIVDIFEGKNKPSQAQPQKPVPPKVPIQAPPKIIPKEESVKTPQKPIINEGPSRPRGRPKKESTISPQPKEQVNNSEGDTINEDPETDNENTVDELAKIQKELNEETENANMEVRKKVADSGKSAIMEYLKNDFHGEAPIKKLESKMIDDGVITSKVFKISLDELQSDAEIYEHRLGHIKLVSEEVDEVDEESEEESPVEEDEETSVDESETESSNEEEIDEETEETTEESNDIMDW